MNEPVPLTLSETTITPSMPRTPLWWRLVRNWRMRMFLSTGRWG
jgi:hypothetical protein